MMLSPVRFIPLSQRVCFILLAAILTMTITGCRRGTPKEKPPIHLNPNMDYQPKYEAQEASDFFVDGAAGRLPVESTVARDQLFDDFPYYTGKMKNSDKYINKAPLDFSNAYLARGKERFGIYCSMCHGESGLGDGIIIERGLIQPPSFHESPVLNFPDGQIFHAITNGARNMQSYKQQIPVKDRWLIVNYVRHLQKIGVDSVEVKP